MFGPKTEKRILTATRQVEQNPRYTSYLNETLQQFGAVLQDSYDTIGVTVGSEGSPGANGTHVYDGTWKVYDYAADEWVVVDDTDTNCKVIDINGGTLVFGRRYIALRCAYNETDNLYYFVVDSGNDPIEGSEGYTEVINVVKLCITREYNDEDPPVLLCVTDIAYETQAILTPTALVGDAVCGNPEDVDCCEGTPSEDTGWFSTCNAGVLEDQERVLPVKVTFSDPMDLLGMGIDAVELTFVYSVDELGQRTIKYVGTFGDITYTESFGLKILNIPSSCNYRLDGFGFNSGGQSTFLQASTGQDLQIADTTLTWADIYLSIYPSGEVRGPISATMTWG